MAGPYVTGTAHLFVGVPATLLSFLVAWPGGSQAVMQAAPGGSLDFGPGQDFSGLFVPQAAAGSSGIVNNVGGGAIQNFPQPPQSLIVALALVTRVPVYLGSARKSPRIESENSFLPWYDDEGGTSLPADDLYEGEQVQIIADLNRWNEPVVAFMQQTVPGPGGFRGIDLPQSIGTSMVMEGATFPLYVQFPYAAKPAMGLRGLPPGYRYFNARLDNPDAFDDLGYQPATRRLIWVARRYLDVVSGIAGLYDHDLSAVGPIN